MAKTFLFDLINKFTTESDVVIICICILHYNFRYTNYKNFTRWILKESNNIYNNIMVKSILKYITISIIKKITTTDNHWVLTS